MNARPGIRSEARYRTVPEARVIEMLLLAGWAFELEAGYREVATKRTMAELEALIELGVGYQTSSHGERLFDPVEVLNTLKLAGLNDLDTFWIDRFVGTGRALVREWSPSGNRADGILEDGAQRFCVTLRRTFDLGQLERGAKVRLRLPLPLPSPSVHDIEIFPIIPDALSARVTRQDGRLDVHFANPVDPLVEIAAKMSFTATTSSRDADAGHLDPTEAAIYLRASEGLIRITPRIHALSRSFGGNDKDPWSIVTACWNYIMDELICGMVHYDQVRADAPGDWVLDSGWYDCQLAAALLVSMCRARGIPARIVGGHLLYRLAPTNHYWAETWIEGRGWIPFDFLSWDLSEGGRDSKWRDHFFGRIDYRMVTQCLPLAFTGPMSVRFPPAWHMIQTRAADEVEITFSELGGGLIYSDRVNVQKLDP
jgi:hypothetical protein